MQKFSGASDDIARIYWNDGELIIKYPKTPFNLFRLSLLQLFTAIVFILDPSRYFRYSRSYGAFI